jgi:hypothetical protein
MMNLLQLAVIPRWGDLMRSVTIDVQPEPSEEERVAIAAALETPDEQPSAWAEAGLREGVDADEP